MADRGVPLPEHLVNTIRKLRRQGFSIRNIARVTNVAKSCVERYVKQLTIDGSVDDESD